MTIKKSFLRPHFVLNNIRMNSQKTMMALTVVRTYTLTFTNHQLSTPTQLCQMVDWVIKYGYILHMCKLAQWPKQWVVASNQRPIKHVLEFIIICGLSITFDILV